MADKVRQRYRVEVRIYEGRKLVLGGGTWLRFKPNKAGFCTELDCTIAKGKQKTLTTRNYTEVLVESPLSKEDTGMIKAGDTFTVHEVDGKLGEGEITKILQQD